VSGGQNFVARGSGQNFAAAQGGGNWNGGWRGRRHFRGPAVAFGLAAPYYYDYATPYDDYAYSDDSAYSEDSSACYRIRIVRGEYRRTWVCE
jgi:hypothetical protein